MGELIRYYRTMNGYSQHDLAQKLHVTVSAVSSWERGISKPAVDVALQLAKDMRITLDEFYIIQSHPETETYSINDEMNLGRAFFKVTHYDVKDHPKRIELTFDVRGLTLYEDFIDENLRVYLVTKKETYSPYLTEISESDSYVSKMSPELEQFPIHAKIYRVKKAFEIKDIETFTVSIQFNGNQAQMEINHDFSHFILQPTPLDKNAFKENLMQIQSDAFVEYLEYITNAKGYGYLRDIIVEHYAFLVETQKPD